MKLWWAQVLRWMIFLTLWAGVWSGCMRAADSRVRAAADVGKIVTRIAVVRATDAKILDEHPNVAVEIGKPLSPEQVAASIRTLYQTGDYGYISAVETPENDGIALLFKVRENLFINQVIIDGLKPPPSESSAVAAMQLSLGQTYRASDIPDAVNRLKDALREEGLYQAKVKTEERAKEDTHQLDVIVHVDQGPRVRVAKIQLTNNSEYPDSNILKLFRLKGGGELTSAKLQSGSNRIRKFFEKKGHLGVRVSVRRGQYSEAVNTLSLTLEVNEGPRVIIAVSGAKISKGNLKKLVPIYQEGSVDTDLLEEGKRNLRERMERDGFFDAKVDYVVNSRQVTSGKNGWKSEEETITYRIDRGSRHKLLRIEFQGNHYFSTETLRGLLTITPSALFVKPRFSRALLDSDVTTIKNTYAANGFLSARIDGQILDDYERKVGDLVIRFVILEGKQTLVSALTIEGRRSIPEEELRAVIESSPGQPYSDIKVTRDRDNILALYFNEGFPNATFSWTAEADTSQTLEAKTKGADAQKQNEDPTERKGGGYRVERAEPMKLIYKITEGSQIRVKHLLYSGYVHTRQRVIRREVKVQRGGPLREGEVVESQQKLYNLGIFNRVTIEPQNANGTDPEKNVVVLVEEARRYTIAYGGGFEVQRLASTTDPTGGQIQAAPRGILEVSKENITGRADSLSLKLRGSTIQGRALLAYTAPNAFNNPKLSLQATAYVEKSQDINTFTQTRYEGNVQLTDQLTARESLLFRYAFRKVAVSNLNIPAEEVPLFNQPTLVSQFSTTWFRDTRNNPADAVSGSFNTADVGIADTGIGSSASFLRVYLQNSTYHRIGRNWSFARSTRLGILQPYRDTVSLSFPAQITNPPPRVIPLPERFYAGGGTSLRGFALNQAGPRDSLTGFPVGGQALLIFNQELRFPLKLPFVGTSLGGALFYDGGNTYSQLSRITFRWSSPQPIFKTAYPGFKPGAYNPEQCLYNCTNELNYFSHVVGFGLRYATPVGPLRIDLGYELNRPEFAIPCKIHVPLCQQGTQLPKLQVFFNLGSSF